MGTSQRLQVSKSSREKMTPLRFPTVVPDVLFSKVWFPLVIISILALLLVFCLFLLSLLPPVSLLFLGAHRPGRVGRQRTQPAFTRRPGYCRLVFKSTCTAVCQQPQKFPMILDLAPAAVLHVAAGNVYSSFRALLATPLSAC